MAGKQKTETQETQGESVIVFKGARQITIGGVAYLPGDELNLTDEQLASQGFKHLFVAKDVEFLDDTKRTREYIAKVKRKDQSPSAEDVKAARETPSE